MNKTEQAVNIFDKLAQQYSDKYMDVSMYHDTLDVFCKAIGKEDAAILEVACGPGNITQYLLGKHPEYRILATDLAPNMLALAQKHNPTAETHIMDARDISKLSTTFDAIVCGFAMPYLPKEDAILWIADAAKMLNENGVLYISTMEGDYTRSGIERSSSGEEIYMHYHEADYLMDALQANDFSAIHVMRVQQQGINNVDLVIVTVK